MSLSFSICDCEIDDVFTLRQLNYLIFLKQAFLKTDRRFYTVCSYNYRSLESKEWNT